MKKKGGIIAAILGVLLLVVGGVLLLTSGPKKSNKELFTDAVEKSLGLFKDGDSKETEAESAIEETIGEIIEKIEKNTYKITVNGEFSEGTGSSNLLGELYVNKDQMYLKVNTDLTGTNLNLEGMYKDDKIYFGLKDILSKVYYVDNISGLIEGLQIKESSSLLNKIVTYAKDSLLDAINNEDVNIESSDLTINGKSYSTKKYSYTFTGETLYNVVVNFVNKVKNDSSIYNELSSILKGLANFLESEEEVNISKDEFNDLLDKALEYAKELKSFGKFATYTIHMNGDDVISRQISVTIPSGEQNVPITIADYKGDNYYKVAISSMGVEAYKLEIKEQSETNYSISLTMMSQEVATGYFTKNNGNYELHLEAAGDLSGNSITIKVNNDGTGSLKAAMEDTELNFEYKIEEVSEMPEMDVTNSASFEEMTEEDKEVLEGFIMPFNFLNSKNEVQVSKQPHYFDDSDVTDCYTEEDGTIVCE